MGDENLKLIPNKDATVIELSNHIFGSDLQLSSEPESLFENQIFVYNSSTNSFDKLVSTQGYFDTAIENNSTNQTLTLFLGGQKKTLQPKVNKNPFDIDKLKVATITLQAMDDSKKEVDSINEASSYKRALVFSSLPRSNKPFAQPIKSTTNTALLDILGLIKNKSIPGTELQTSNNKSNEVINLMLSGEIIARLTPLNNGMKIEIPLYQGEDFNPAQELLVANMLNIIKGSSIEFKIDLKNFPKQAYKALFPEKTSQLSPSSGAGSSQ